MAVTVALTFAPQLVESAQRVRRARRLRGGANPRRHVVREIGIPVLQDALDRSLLLAAGMDSRGYGRIGAVARRTRALTGALLLLGLIGVATGVYGLLDATAPRALGVPMLVGGLVVAGAGFVLSGRRVERTVYPQSGVGILDVLAAGVSKAAALAFLQERWGVTAAETLAIGDNWNDHEMLERAGLGLVMGNADPEMHRLGLAILPTNDEDGVALAIEEHVLAR